MQTVDYAPGRPADLFGDPADPAVLIWHGKQSDARATVTALAERVAGHGFAVVAPDWDSDAPDGGRSDLLASVRFTHERHPDPLVLVGWSLGGVAAAGLTVRAVDHDARLAATVCLAGAFMVPDPISGAALPSRLPSDGPRAPFTLLHGTADDVVPVSASRDFAALLRDNGWPVDVVELDTDHAAIAGAGYDPAADRYLPGTGTETLAMADEVAARIAAVVSR
ncbi:alpha/beta hydrolase [Mycolicibacterium thermoresistibile]